MRKQNVWFYGCCLAGLFVLTAVIPLLKFLLEVLVLAVSLLPVAHYLLQQAPVCFYCSNCGKTVYFSRYGNAGKRCLCHDGDGHRIQIPQPTLSQVVIQILRRVILKQPPQSLAFRARVLPS